MRLVRYRAQTTPGSHVFIAQVAEVRLLAPNLNPAR